MGGRNLSKEERRDRERRPGERELLAQVGADDTDEEGAQQAGIEGQECGRGRRGRRDPMREGWSTGGRRKGEAVAAMRGGGDYGKLGWKRNQGSMTEE